MNYNLYIEYTKIVVYNIKIQKNSRNTVFTALGHSKTIVPDKVNRKIKGEKSMNKKLKSALVIMSAALLLSSSMVMGAKKEFSFSITKGGTVYSVSNPKSDSERYAYVTVNTANLIPDDQVRYSVALPTSSTEVSVFMEFYGNTKPYKQTLKYLPGHGEASKSYRLRVKSYKYSVSMSGVWNS